MNTPLWIAQIILAAAFLYSGICKSVFSKAELISKGQTGVVDMPVLGIKLIAFAEIAGAIGIIIPWWSGILPLLTPVTAVCFGILMIFAARIHYKLGEPRNVATNIFLLLLSVFVAWGRFNY